MPERPNVQKAKIVDVNNSSKEVVCHFNPETLSLDRTLNWDITPRQGSNSPRVSFGGAQASDLTIPLLFDTTADGTDVRNAYATLIDLSKIDASQQNPEPPLCRFEWGTFLTFTAVIHKLSQKFMLFKADGTPLRAEVTVTFKQVEEATQPQNPTTRSEPRKIWVVHEGQSLDWIAYQEYGNPACWRHIAEINDIDDPLNLQPGQVLKIVPLP
jgi:hypothetical protein